MDGLYEAPPRPFVGFLPFEDPYESSTFED
jgi:hypothetical protein